jgi:hypothetical protein
MSEHANRRIWLQALQKPCGGYRALADLVEAAPAYFSQISTGRRDMGEAVARRIERRLGLPPESMDQPFDEAVLAMATLPAVAPSMAHVARKIPPLPDGADGQHVVPMLEVRATAGLGELRPEHDPIVGSLRLNNAWVRDRLRSITSIDNLVTLIAYGDSMEPAFCDGSILLVDRGVRAVTVDGVYVLSMENQLYVKRVTRRLPDGALVVTSDNPAYARSVIENGERSQVEGLGKVVWTFDSKGV